jgi:hypothetical protein
MRTTVIVVLVGLACLYSTSALADPLEPSTAVDARYDSRFTVEYDEPSHEIQWYLSLKGDCDQNGVVNISDITRLAAYLNQSVAPGERGTAKAAADCDENGEVNISDISAMGAHLNEQLTAYRIWVRPDFAPKYPWHDDGDSTEYDAQLPFADAVGDTAQDHLQWTINTQGFERQWLWVQEVLATGPGRLSKLVMSHTGDRAINTYDPNWGLVYNPVTTSISFYHTLRGDYDQDGLVSLNDSTPIALFFGESGPWNVAAAQWAADGTRDSQITFAEFPLVKLLLGENIGAVPGGYNLYRQTGGADPSPYPTDPEELVAQINVSDGIVLGRRRSYVHSPPPAALLPGTKLWLRPVTADGELGARSEVLTLP